MMTQPRTSAAAAATAQRRCTASTREMRSEQRFAISADFRSLKCPYRTSAPHRTPQPPPMASCPFTACAECGWDGILSLHPERLSHQGPLACCSVCQPCGPRVACAIVAHVRPLVQYSPQALCVMPLSMSTALANQAMPQACDASGGALGAVWPAKETASAAGQGRLVHPRLARARAQLARACAGSASDRSPPNCHRRRPRSPRVFGKALVAGQTGVVAHTRANKGRLHSVARRAWPASATRSPHSTNTFGAAASPVGRGATATVVVVGPRWLLSSRLAAVLTGVVPEWDLADHCPQCQWCPSPVDSTSAPFRLLT